MPGRVSAEVTWSARRVPLSPHAAFGYGAVAARLAKRLLALDEGVFDELVAVVAPEALLVIGSSSSLPWVDGVRYLGRAPSAPKLLVPTNLEPSVPIDLVQRALLGAHPDLAAPVAVIVEPPRLVATGGARSIDRARLARWLSA